MMLFLLFLYFFTGNHAPAIPAGDLHAITTNIACMECHAPAKQTPLKDAHPHKEFCLDCHKVNKIKKASSADHV